nr:hypothetical protein [Tanacetum cinerariifolium]
MSEPMYPEYIPLEDEHVLSAEEQPLPPVDSPTTKSPRYVVESDPEEDPEEYEDDESEDGPVDYPMDRGDDGDDDDGDSSGDDVDDKDEDEEDEEEEEHLALTDAAVVVPTVEPVFPREGTKPVIPPPSTDITTTGARIIVHGPMAHSSPPPVPSPSLPPSGCPTQIQKLRITSTQALIDAVISALPSPPLPPPLYIPPAVDRRDDIHETELAPRKKSCLFALGPSTLDAEVRRRGIIEVGYGIRDLWVDPAEAVLKIAPMILGEVNTGVIELAELHEHDTHDLYALLEDAQDSKTHISQRVTMNSQRVDLLMKDMIAHQETILILKEAAYASREAWAHPIGLSQAIHYELQTHRECESL